MLLLEAPLVASFENPYVSNKSLKTTSKWTGTIRQGCINIPNFGIIPQWVFETKKLIWR
jgi:hypothetical protein